MGRHRNAEDTIQGVGKGRTALNNTTTKTGLLVNAAHPVDGDLLHEELVGVVEEIGVGHDIR